MDIDSRTFLPPNLPAALVAAANALGAHRDRVERIDHLIQDAADQYPELLRQPNDTSRVGEWDALRAAWPA